MTYPEQVRLNMRRRGPMESFKVRVTDSQVDLNLERLKTAVEKLRTSLAVHKTQVYNGKPLEAVEPEMPIRLARLERHINIVERGE